MFLRTLSDTKNHYNKNIMEAEQDRSVKKHQAQQLGFNSLQVVLSIAMVAVGTSASILMELNL